MDDEVDMAGDVRGELVALTIDEGVEPVLCENRIEEGGGEFAEKELLVDWAERGPGDGELA